MKLAGCHDVIELCQALVQIPSENPSGAPESAGEAAVARFVGEILSAAGAEVSLVEVAPNRPNVYGTFPAPSAGAKRILFAPHLDTVTVQGMTVPPFAAELRQGRLYGRGACDTKGSIASMLWAIATTDLNNLEVAVSFAGLADEEAEQIGSQACARENMADFVLVGEPTNLDVVFTHKGTAWIRLEANGKSVHASAPERGINAIEIMAQVCAALKAKLPELCPTESNDILGQCTFSLGRIQGGSKINVVPDRCTADIDVRTLPGQEQLVDRITEFLLHEGFPVEVRPLKISAPLWTDPENPMVIRLAGLGAKLTSAAWFCDAAFFALAGTPAVAIGPGSIAQAHTADEYIEVAELERGVEFFRKYLQTFRHG